MCNFFVLESLQFETFIDGNRVPIVFDLIYNVYFWNHMKKTESIDTGDYLTQKDKYKGQRLIRLPNCQRLPNTTSPRITLAGSKRMKLSLILLALAPQSFNRQFSGVLCADL